MTSAENETGVAAGDGRMLIDGELQVTAGAAAFDVVHPATGEVAGQASDGTIQLADALESRKEELRRILITEVGCPISVTGSQIDEPINEVRHWAEYGRAFGYAADNGVHETPPGPARRTIFYEPTGVVGAITPWNVPFYLNIADRISAPKEIR